MTDTLMVFAPPDRPELMIIPEGSESGIDRRVERAAGHLGRDTADVERLLFDLSALEEQGVFVNVDARNFGLLDQRLDWRALGVTLPRTGDFAFRNPRHGLAPDRYRLPRSVLQVQGCPLQCTLACYVPETHSIEGGVVLPVDTLVGALLDPVGAPRDGVSVLGGEPVRRIVGA